MPRSARGPLLLAACAAAGLLAVLWAGCGRPTTSGKQATCAEDAHCTTPAPCELAEGAKCIQGFCRYAAKACDAPPVPECVEGDATYRSYASLGTCQADGSCSYDATDTACAGCSINCLGTCLGVACTDLHRGCRLSGECVPGRPPTCTYLPVPDQQPLSCDDGDPCTGEDSCSGGDCTGTPIADGQTCSGRPGVCMRGECVECLGEGDCDDGNSCTTDACNATHCTHVPLADGVTCSDGNACTTGDACHSGACVPGTARTCTASDQCHDVGVCNPATGLCSTPPRAQGMACNDGNSCTHTDACDGNGCLGIAITCASDPGPCGIRRACNGTASCTSSYPDSGTACDDLNACTHSDRCNGTGTCVGTAYSCSSNTECATYACDGGGGCQVSYASSSTSCGDGNNCTYNDHCDGYGSCAGTLHTCTSSTCTNSSCNGQGGCNTSYNNGAECGSCMDGHCNNGSCIGGHSPPCP